MGFVFSKLFDGLFAIEEKRILMLGLDAAGKTTILYKLKLGEVIQSIPTIGFNVETVQYKKIKFTVWDIGAQQKIRLLWKHYFANTQALIFVIDSSDLERIELARQELEGVLNAEEMKDCAVLILANKQDQAVMSVAQITEHLKLPQLRRQWFIQGTCALTGDGIYDGLDWLVKALQKNN